MMNRRSLITGLVSLVAAPAIVRATSLMPVKTMIEDPRHYYVGRGRLMICTVADVGGTEEWVDIEVSQLGLMPWTRDTAYDLGGVIADYRPLREVVDGKISQVTFAPEPTLMLPPRGGWFGQD
jgi:hypothetical protein